MSDELPDDAELIALLPWYAAGTLDAKDAARIEAALAEDPALRASLARVQEERSADIERNEALDSAPGALDRLMSRIEGSAQPEANFAGRLRSVWAGLSAALSARPGVLALAGVAAALVIVAESGALIALIGQGQQGTGPYVVASVEPSQPADRAVLVLAFAPKASVADVSALLLAAGATIIEGPKPGGLYRISVDRAAVTTALAALKARPDLVTFAAPGS